MATYVVTSTNWNDPSFWSAISEASGPNTLDFSALSSRYSVDLDAETDITTIYDSTSGTSYSIGGDGVSGTDTTLGLATHFSYFDTIYGSSGDDTLRGGTGNDFIDGGAGDDILEGDNGNDALFGGEGNDIFVINDDDGSDSVYGGETGTDFDAIAFANWITTGGVTVTFTGDEAGDYSFNGATADASGTFTGIEAIWGTAYDDTLDASASSTDQELVGHAGNDVITGGSGDDNIIGGTGDDTLTGGAGDDTFSYQAGDGVDIITDFNTGNSGALGDGDTTNNDFIDLSAFYDNIDELRADQADDGILNQSNDGVGGVDYSDNDSFGTGSLTFTGAETDPSFFTADNTGVVCFAAGTLIETPEGARPVETLRPGDLVSTLDNGSQVLRWVGARDVSPEDMVRDPGLHPVVIEPGVFGAKRRLMLSQQHGVLLKQGLARATHLARHAAGIRIAKGVKHVRYHHLLFDRHQIVLAEGVPCESLYPGPQALAMLTSSGRASLAQHLPWLPEAMRDESLTDRAYGPTARVFLNRREVAEAMAPVLA